MAVRQWKYRLKRRCRANGVKIEQGFNWRTSRVGKPCFRTLKNYQHFVGIEQSGEFDRDTLDALYPPRFRARIAEVAAKELGTHESSTNWGRRIRDYLHAAGITFPTAWCAAFATFVAHKAGYRGPWPSQLAWVPSWAEWARHSGRSIARVKARKGDLVCLNWPGTSSTPDHIAVVTGNLLAAKQLTTIGGNEGEPGAVRRAWRPYTQIHTAIRLRRFARR